jgi:hypothetical protein
MNRRLARKIYGRWTKGRTVRGIAATLERDPKAWVETDVLIAALTDNAREPLPEIVSSYLRQRLDGDARKRRGRGRFANCPTKTLRDLLITTTYTRFEAWLIARDKRHGLEGWSGVRKADWWQGPPSERAARMVLRKRGLNLSWQRVRDIACAGRDRRQPGIS